MDKARIKWAECETTVGCAEAGSEGQRRFTHGFILLNVFLNGMVR